MILCKFYFFYFVPSHRIRRVENITRAAAGAHKIISYIDINLNGL